MAEAGSISGAAAAGPLGCERLGPQKNTQLPWLPWADAEVDAAIEAPINKPTKRIFFT
jgi:hypothetical protein